MGFTPQGQWIAPVMREAIASLEREAKRTAAVYFGDRALASELMEEAIQLTKEHLETLAPIDARTASEILERHYRNVVRRRRRADNKFVFRGTSTDVEVIANPAKPALPPLEAELDLATILRDTSPELRRAMLMRYGSRSSWGEVAKELSKSKNAVRMSCERELIRIRKKMGLRGDGK
jgi:DNA-directed RNA polymerase specialized sigma24 family protein